MTAQMVELEPEECFDLLAQNHLGRVGLIDAGRPVVLPVNYVLDRGYIVFQSTHGSKLRSAVSGNGVAFEIDGSDPLFHRGFSVLAYGPAELVSAPEETERLAHLPVSGWWAPARDRWVWIRIDEVTGRRLVS